MTRGNGRNSRVGFFMVPDGLGLAVASMGCGNAGLCIRLFGVLDEVTHYPGHGRRRFRGEPVSDLATRLGAGRETVRRHLKHLAVLGYAYITDGGAGSRGANWRVCNPVRDDQHPTLSGASPSAENTPSFSEPEGLHAHTAPCARHYRLTGGAESDLDPDVRQVAEVAHLTHAHSDSRPHEPHAHSAPPSHDSSDGVSALYSEPWIWAPPRYYLVPPGADGVRRPNLPGLSMCSECGIPGGELWPGQVQAYCDDCRGIPRRAERTTA